MGGNVPTAQPGPGDQRCRDRRRGRRELNVESLDVGVAVGGGLLGTPVNIRDGVIDVDERDPRARVNTGDQPRRPASESGERL